MPVLVLLMTDVEGSTRQWAAQPDAMLEAMRRHHEIVHGAIERHGGWRPVDQGEGDAVFAAFESAQGALAAVLEFQRALGREAWPSGTSIRDRVGLHVGDVVLRDGNLFGPVVNRAARIRGLGAGGQVLLSAAVFELLRDRLPSGAELADLGEHRMKDLIRPERIFELRAPGIASGFPPLAGLDRARHNLPQQASSFLGREADVAALVDLVRADRLVTVTGFGGMGKTRLALQVAAELAIGDGDGVWFVDLAAIDDAALLAVRIADTLGIAAEAEDPLEAVVGWLRDREVLLVLDNLEQLLPAAAALVARIVEAGPGVRVLVTSREAVQVRAEHVYALDPLPLPVAGSAEESDLGSLTTYASVALLLERAAAVRRGFVLTTANAAAIAAICRRLDGLPLALELAASRLRMLSPEALLARLDDALGVLTSGSRDLPDRQQTLRSTIAWSVDALEEPARRALARLSVFAGDFSVEAAEAVIGDQVDALTDVAVLVERSLLQVRPDTNGADRYRLLVTIREFAAALLDPSDRDDAELLHAHWFASQVRLAPGWSADQFEARNRAVPGMWPEIRVAVARLHDRGLVPTELALTADAASGVVRWGRPSEAGPLIEHALQHRGADTSAEGVFTEFRLRMQSAVLAQRFGRFADASALFDEAIACARRTGDPSVVATALCRAITGQSDARKGSATLAEAEALLPSVASAHRYPRWIVEDRLETAVINAPIVDRALAERLWRPRLASAGNDRARACYYVASLLADRSADDEALALLDEYLEHDPPEVEPFGIAVLRIMGVGLLLRSGRAARARQVCDRIDAAFEVTGLDELRPEAEWCRAALDRAEGAPAEARARLDRLLATPTTDRADALWLLAVVLRETRDPGRAEVLRAATTAALLEDGNPNVQRACALEQALSCSSERPETAVALLRALDAHRDEASIFPDVDHRVVRYDTEGMLRALGAPVDADRQEAAGTPGSSRSIAELLAELVAP